MKDLKHIELENKQKPYPLTDQGRYVGWLFDNLDNEKNKAKLFRVLAEKMEVCID